MLYAVFKVLPVRTETFGVMSMILKQKRHLSLAKMIPVTSLIFWNGLRSILVFVLDFMDVFVEPFDMVVCDLKLSLDN